MAKVDLPAPQAADRGDRKSLAAAAASATAVVAAALVAVTALGLLADFAHRTLLNPSESSELIELKQKLATSPHDAEVLAAIRDLDLELRQEYFRQRAFAARGVWLLIGGIAVLLIAAKTAAVLNRRLPTPETHCLHHDRELPTMSSGRRAVLVCGGLLVAAAAALSVRASSGLPSRAELTEEQASSPSVQNSESPPLKPETAAAAKPAPASPSSKPYDHAAAWPRFRGPGGRGISAYENIPTDCDAAGGKNIVWKSPVPLEGNSSPVVWNDRIFLTGANETKRQVYCFGIDGKLLWEKDVPGTPESTKAPPKVMPETGFASPTPATDGKQVYAIFANGDMAALDFAGKLVWSRSLGVPESSYGYASSLTTWNDRVIVQLDQAGAKDNKSKLLALDAATGKTVWETSRPVPNSWASPIVADVAGKPQIVTAADPWVIAYQPQDGKEIWRAKCLRQDVGPSPTWFDGTIYVGSQFPQITAIAADGAGDVTASKIAWAGEDGLPETCSPLATPEHLLVLTDSGLLTCYDRKDGKKLWEHDFETNFKASPSLVGKYVYALGEEGKLLVVEPTAAECKKVDEGTLGEPLSASPAFQDGRMYIRGKQHLFAVGKK